MCVCVCVVSDPAVKTYIYNNNNNNITIILSTYCTVMLCTKTAVKCEDREHYAFRTLRIKTKRQDGGKGCRNTGLTWRDIILLYCCYYYYYNVRGMRPYTFCYNKNKRLLYYQRVVYDGCQCVGSVYDLYHTVTTVEYRPVLQILVYLLFSHVGVAV